jgi:uncharacterized Zn-finger protein
MVPIIITLKVLKYHPMITFGSDHPKIFVEVIENKEKQIDEIDFVYRYN